MAQENRRVRMTKKLLNNSLLHFLETKTVNKVTVTEICEEADVNRSTYYAHFTDPYQQLKSMEESIFSELHEKVDKNAPASLSSEEDVRRMIRRVLTFIKPYRKVIRILYRNGAVDLGEDMLEFFGRPYYKESHKPYDTYIYSYMFISKRHGRPYQVLDLK